VSSLAPRPLHDARLFKFFAFPGPIALWRLWLVFTASDAFY